MRTNANCSRIDPSRWTCLIMLKFTDIEVGYQLPEHIFGPVTRTTLALFAGGSGDHNPIHIDIDFAKRAGFQDVFVHGMFTMAQLAQMVALWAPLSALRSLKTRFTSITPVNSTVKCSAEVSGKKAVNGENRVELLLSAELEDGTRTVIGQAVVALD